jgi:hypothetical protein
MHKLLSTGVWLLLAVLPLQVLAGNPVYPVREIPAALLKNADVVKRLDETVVRINGLADTRITTHRIITVLNEAGAESAQLREFYSNLEEIRAISGALFDANGKLVKRLKQGEISDAPAWDGFSLMNDARIKQHRFYYNTYPYTVEYSVETRMNNTAFWPRWVPQNKTDCTVEHGMLSVTVPTDYTLRYRSYLYNHEPATTTGKGTKTYTWEVQNLAALEPEAFPDELYRRTPSVFLGATAFEMGKYKGDMSTWKDFGAFVYRLNEGRDMLPDNIRAKVQELTAGKTREEKINTLYRFLQQNNRYISIQLGIGGWQTFDAASVAANGYGDCKALSNYMMSLLKAAGIKSNCVLVKAGRDEHTIREDFPSFQFNHVILCVPGDKDSTWLECTENTLPAGYLGYFTDDRPVLLIDEKDSKLVRTPRYDMNCNEQIRNIAAAIDATGNIDINVTTVRSGLQQDDLHGRLRHLSRETQLELLRKNLGLSSYDITGYQCRELGTAIPSIEEKIQIKGHNYATVTGKRMFLLPDILSRDGMKLDDEANRASEIRFDFAYRNIDTVRIALPAGYKPESVMAPVSLSCQFGNYSAVTTIEGNTLTLIRKMERRSGVFPPAGFPELVKFYGTVYRSERSKVVLIKE